MGSRVTAWANVLPSWEKPSPKPSLHGPFYSASRSTVNESLLVSALMYHMTTHAGKSVGLE